MAITGKRPASNAARDTSNLRKLQPLAKKINAAVDKANKAGIRESDLRLTAAQYLAEASDFCKDNKINFKSWVETNVTQGYETCRKLVAVGKSDNPVLALEDMRAKNAAANRTARAKAKAPTSAGRVNHTSAPRIAGPSLYVATLDSANSLNDSERSKLAKELASSVGMVTVVQNEAQDPKKKETPMQAGKRAAQSMSAPDRRKFLKWLTEIVEKDAASQMGIMPQDGMIKRGAQAHM